MVLNIPVGVVLASLKEVVIKGFVGSVKALNARNLPRWIMDGEGLLSTLKSSEAWLKVTERVETKRRKAMRARLISEIARLYSCIEDCLEPMKAASNRLRQSGKFYVWNPEGRSTRYLQVLMCEAQGIIEESKRYLEQKQEIEQGQSTVSEMEHGQSTVSEIELQEHNQAEPTGASGSGDQTVDQKSQIIDDLRNEEEFPVICIQGDSGMGKTKLAHDVFYTDQSFADGIEAFTWVSINKDFQANQVLQEILLDLIPYGRVDRKGEYEIELTHESFAVQKMRKCLIVLDNICTREEWDSIRAAFPIGDSLSKILITTPSNEVAGQVNASGGHVYKVDPLTQEECFKMVKTMSANLDEQKQKDIGKAIFDHCEGSRLLASVVLGFALRTDTDQFLRELDSLEIRNQTDKAESKALDLIYDGLTNDSKQCLLYMGQFPKGQDIQVEKLYFLLAAEDLAMPRDNDTCGSRETTYNDSISKILDIFHCKLCRDDVDQSIKKSFRLPDLIRNFCITQGLLEELFNIVDFERGKYSSMSAHRLAIYLSNYRDEDATSMLSQIGYTNQRRVCSLLIFDTNGSEQKSWPPEIRDLEKFLFLRVLDFDGVDFRFRKLPRGIGKLVLLRYLSFQGCYLEAFPCSITNFPCLETLDLRVRWDCKMIIPDILHEMKRLRHLFFPMAYKSADNSKLQLQGLEKLETLVNFDTGVCRVEVLRELTKIQILTVVSHGNDEDLKVVIQLLDNRAEVANMQLSVDIKNFECYAKESIPNFKKLVESECIHSVKVEGSIFHFPQNVKFSSNITQMVFDGSELEDDRLLNLLGDIAELRSLVLSNDAFMVSEMTFSGESKFPELRILKILNLEYLTAIKFQEDLIENLSTLVIEGCAELTVFIPKPMDCSLRHFHGSGGEYWVKPDPTIT